jgi:hypothetical protein
VLANQVEERETASQAVEMQDPGLAMPVRGKESVMGEEMQDLRS